jgi:MtaA/CmuA family methyltransferase
MNGYERIKAALAGKPTDKVPIMLHNFMMAAHEAGFTMAQFRDNPKAIAESFIKSVEKYRYDGILVDIDTVTLAGAVGVPVDLPEDLPARSHQGRLPNIEDIVNVEPAKIEDYKYIRIWLESVRLLMEYFKDEIFIRGNCDQAPFSLASLMRGIENWMVDLLTSEERFVFKVLDYCADATCQFIRLMAQTGCHMVSNGDSLAGPSLISPAMYEKFALRFEKTVVETAHSLGLPYTLHICGSTEDILDRMILTGADAFELDYGTDPQKAFTVLHDRATFIGNIDPSGVLALGTPDEVRRKTLDLLKVYSGSNRFVLNSGCALPSSTPSANIRAMIETARGFR